MFIFRWIKRLLIVIGLGTVIYWGIQYVQSDSAFRTKIDDFRESTVVKEGIKDLKTWTSDALKGAGTKLESDISNKDREELDRILQKELGIKIKEEKTPQQNAMGDRNQGGK